MTVSLCACMYLFIFLDGHVITCFKTSVNKDWNNYSYNDMERVESTNIKDLFIQTCVENAISDDIYEFMFNQWTMDVKKMIILDAISDLLTGNLKLFKFFKINLNLDDTTSLIIDFDCGTFTHLLQTKMRKLRCYKLIQVEYYKQAIMTGGKDLVDLFCDFNKSLVKNTCV